MRFLVISFLVLIVSSGSALAGPRPLAGDQRSPPVFLDIPSLWINIVTRNDRGYSVMAELRLAGASSKSDRIRLDWKSRGKVVGSLACTSTFYDEVKSLYGRCEPDKEINAKGPIDIDVIYIDDQEDKEYLVTTLKTTIRTWKGIGNTQYWGHLPDDLLALAWVRYSDDSNTFHVPLIDFGADS